MDPKVIAEIVPAIAIVFTFGMPVAIVFVINHFKYKNRELEAELEARRLLSERDKAELSARVERLENVLLGGARPVAQVAAPEQAPAALHAALPDLPAAESAEEQATKRARERG